MTWAILVVAASLILAVVNTLDKYVLTKWVRNPFVSVLVLGFIGLIAGITVWLSRGFAPLSTLNIFGALIAGLCYLVSVVFYFKALKIEEMSRVVPLYYLSPLFILIFAAFFLGEIFTLANYLGIFALMIGAILVSSRSFLRIKLNLAFWWMMIAVLGWSANLILTKYLLNYADYWTIFAWVRLGGFIGIIPLIFIYLPELRDTVRRHGSKFLAAASLSETLTLVSILLVTIAASVGYVTLVEALSALQALFVLLIALLLSVFLPSIIKEELNRAVVLQKIIATILMFAGALLVV